MLAFAHAAACLVKNKYQINAVQCFSISLVKKSASQRQEDIFLFQGFKYANIAFKLVTFWEET